MRSAKEERAFPYAARTICYIEVSSDGKVRQVPSSKSAMEEACRETREGRSTLYAVWPGNYRSDLFLIDDIDALSDAYGIDREKRHVHIVDRSLSDVDDGKSTYANVNIAFKCGCELDFNNIKSIARALANPEPLRIMNGWLPVLTGSQPFCGIHVDPES